MKRDKSRTKTFKATFLLGNKVILDVLAAMRQVTQSRYLEMLVEMADKYLKLHGSHITDNPALNPAPPIAQILEAIDLQELSEEVDIPMERLEKIAAGDRPTDSDLSFLAASEKISYSLEQLMQGRKLQFDRQQEVQNAK